MTTLSDEEFQRLNNQLLELKVANYNLEASLSKSTLECNSVRGENELLKRQLAEQQHSSPVVGNASSGQSIKSKLNPFALAKNIATKVEARRNVNSSSAAADKTVDKSATSVQSQLQPLEAANQAASSASTDLARRLESQEAEFLKTNETLKQEIVLLQRELQVAQDGQAKALARHQAAQQAQQPTQVTTRDKSSATEPSKPSASSEHQPQSSSATQPLSLSSTTLITATSPSSTSTSSTSNYSPSRQLQQSLAQLTASLNLTSHQHRQKWIDAAGPLVDRFIDSLSLDDCDPEQCDEQKAAIEALLQAMVPNSTTSTTSHQHQSLEETRITTITDSVTEGTSTPPSEQQHLTSNDGLLDNTTEDFKQLVAFCSRLQAAQQAEAQAFLSQLTREVVKHNRRQREVFSEALAEEAGRVTQLKAELGRLQAEMATLEAVLNQLSGQVETLKAEKGDLEKCIEEQATSAAAEASEQAKSATEQLSSAQQTIERLKAEVAEAANASKISEKRGLKIIKELTRQLASEKKRAEKLQSMIVTNGGGGNGGNGNADGPTTSTNTFNNPFASSKRESGDTGSCSSGSGWSYMAESQASQASKSNNQLHHQAHNQDTGFSDLEIIQSPASGSKSTSVITDQPPSTSSLHPNRNAANAAAASNATLTSKPRGASVTSAASSGTLESENVSLLARISSLQQENWRLEELVDQLQHELANKSRLIEFYCIRSDGRSSTAAIGATGGSASPVQEGSLSRGVLSRQNSGASSVSSSVSASVSNSTSATSNPVLRMVSFLKEKGEQVAGGGGNVASGAFNDTSSSSLKSSAMMDVNRKLQHMVEEILTKNMHLQANLEQLSNQLMEAKGRLKKYEPESERDQLFPAAASRN